MMQSEERHSDAINARPRARRRRGRRSPSPPPLPVAFPVRQVIECSLLSFALVTDESDLQRFRQQADASLTNYLRRVLETFRSQMSTGVSELGIPRLDPLHVADIYLEDDHMRAHFFKVAVTGVSLFDIAELEVRLEQLQLHLRLVFPQLNIKGNYELSGRAVGILPLSGDGIFYVCASTLEAAGQAALINDSNNVLQIERLFLDLKVAHMDLHFANLLGGGSLGSMVNGVLRALSTTIFERIKPRLLAALQDSLRAKLNAELRHVNVAKFIPGGLAHVLESAGRRRVTNANQYLDHVLENAREQIQQGGLDPLPLPDGDTLSEGQLLGLASVHRAGEAALSFNQDGTTLEALIGFSNLFASYRWNKKLVFHLSGRTSARVRHVTLRVKINQPSSCGSQATLEDFIIERLGSINVKMTGLGPATWLAEKITTLVVNLMRHRLADRLTGPIRQIIELNVGLASPIVPMC